MKAFLKLVLILFLSANYVNAHWLQAEGPAEASSCYLHMKGDSLKNNGGSSSSSIESNRKSGSEGKEVKIISEPKEVNFLETPFVTPDGKITAIKYYKGNIVLVNWWATSCSACVEEIPELNSIYDKYKEKNIAFLSFVWDPENLSDFLSKHSFLFTHCKTNNKLTNLMGNKFPRSILIDQNGKVVFDDTGYSKMIVSEIAAKIETLLSK